MDSERLRFWGASSAMEEEMEVPDEDDGSSRVIEFTGKSRNCIDLCTYPCCFILRQEKQANPPLLKDVIDDLQ